MSLNPLLFRVTLSPGFSARRHSRKEADKLRELLSLMRREASSWDNPQAGACHAIPSLRALQNEKLALERLSQVTNQKSVTQSAAKSATKPATKSASAISIRQYWAGHQQLRQECRGSELPLDAGAVSFVSLEKPRIPVNQHVKKKSKSEEAVEADLGNKLKHFTHGINPDTKGQGHKECILRCKDEKAAKTKRKKAEKSPPSTKRPMNGAKLEKEEGFFDALQCLDSEFQRQSVQSGQSCFLPLSSGSSKGSPLLTRATQPENPSHISICTSAKGTCLPQESTQSRKKELRGSQTSASS
ncbi:hypothetical protein K5549_001492 [Capra hircus]|nr:hypothetical protein K5549_001492 [Capra hircus]